MQSKKILKTLWKNKMGILLTLILSSLFFYLLLNLYIIKSTQNQIFDDQSNIPQAQVALILGSRVYSNGNMSDVLKDRTIRALELYNAGKVTKLLVSGDHGKVDYDEVNTVKKYLLDQGVNPEDIFLDHAGFDTYDSLYRAQYIFQVKSIIVVTQEFHLPRAVYIGKALNMETYGYTADRQLYLNAQHYKIRETLARLKAFGNLLFHSKPKYLGEPIPITGNGQLSWD